MSSSEVKLVVRPHSAKEEGTPIRHGRGWDYRWLGDRNRGICGEDEPETYFAGRM